jgi:pSer/pThr/pTyr-binding forkhead associated (FHA) protein
VIGRSSSCQIVIGEPTVSRHHARLRSRDGRWVLQDLGSTNGTYLNGRRVGRCELRPGDLVLLGEAAFRVD